MTRARHVKYITYYEDAESIAGMVVMTTAPRRHHDATARHTLHAYIYMEYIQECRPVPLITRNLCFLSQLLSPAASSPHPWPPPSGPSPAPPLPGASPLAPPLPVGASPPQRHPPRLRRIQPLGGAEEDGGGGGAQVGVGEDGCYGEAPGRRQGDDLATLWQVATMIRGWRTAVWELDKANHRNIVRMPVLMRELWLEMWHDMHPDSKSKFVMKAFRGPLRNEDCHWDYAKSWCGFAEHCEYRYTFGDVHLGMSCRLKNSSTNLLQQYL